MLFTFKSAATANLIMHERNGKEILALLGKNPEDGQGIITVQQLPAALATLQCAVATARGNPPEQNADGNEAEGDEEQPVGLAQRAAPFIDMLERAIEAGEPVVWGV